MLESAYDGLSQNLSHVYLICQRVLKNGMTAPFLKKGKDQGS